MARTKKQQAVLDRYGGSGDALSLTSEDFLRDALKDLAGRDGLYAQTNDAEVATLIADISTNIARRYADVANYMAPRTKDGDVASVQKKLNDARHNLEEARRGIELAIREFDRRLADYHHAQHSVVEWAQNAILLKEE